MINILDVLTRLDDGYAGFNANERLLKDAADAIRQLITEGDRLKAELDRPASITGAGRRVPDDSSEI